jgi:hypothetical protein
MGRKMPQWTLHHGLFYSKAPLQIQAYCSSDRPGGLDYRRSISGFVLFLGSYLIS